MPRSTEAPVNSSKAAPAPQMSTSYQSAPALRKAQSATREDGVYEVMTTPEGVTLEAEYSNRRFKRWAARSAGGKRLPVSFQKAAKAKSARSLDLLSPQGGEVIEVCYVCFRNPVPTGARILCYEIPCR